MGKGKRKTVISTKPKLGDASVSEHAEKDAKENKHGQLVASHGQLTITSCLNKLRSPLKNCPLAPLHENNSATSINETNKQGAAELNPPKQVKNTQSESSNDETAVPRDSETRKQTQSGQRINSKKAKGKKVKVNPSEQNQKVTDYFPIRRSCRKSKAELTCEKQRHIDDLIKNNVEEGLKVKYIEGKGRGIFAEREFPRGQFVVEYHGDLLEIADAKAKESQYAQDPNTGCYMFYFRHIDKTYCVDATKETSRLGRLINHSKNGNLQPKLHEINGVPHLILLASRDIKVDEELLYDYGDRSKEATEAHPWLKQ